MTDKIPQEYNSRWDRCPNWQEERFQPSPVTLILSNIVIILAPVAIALLFAP